MRLDLVYLALLHTIQFDSVASQSHPLPAPVRPDSL